MNPYAILFAVLMVGAAYVVGRFDGKKLVEGEQAIAERVAGQAAQASREAAAKAIAGITVRHTTIQNALEREVRNVPVYHDPDCKLTPDGLRNLNAALAGGQVASSPELPASGAAE